MRAARAFRVVPVSSCGSERVLCGVWKRGGTLVDVMRYPGMEPQDEQREKPRRDKVIIKSPLRLAIFSAAILTLGAFALHLIAEGEPLISEAEAAVSVALF